MNVHFTARQMTLTPELRQYCEKRLNSLEKLMGSVLEVDVICSVERNRHKAEIYVKAKGASLFVVEETPEMLNSLNRAFDSLEKKIKKEREKFRERKRRSSRVTKEIPYVSEPGETEKRVVRTPGFFSQAHGSRRGPGPVRRGKEGRLRFPETRHRKMGGPVPAQGRKLWFGGAGIILWGVKREAIRFSGRGHDHPGPQIKKSGELAPGDG